MTDEEIEYGIETACNCANSNPSPCWTVNPYPIIRDYIQRLKVENASLRERLDKAFEPPCKVGDEVCRFFRSRNGTILIRSTTIKSITINKKGMRIEFASLFFGGYVGIDFKFLTYADLIKEDPVSVSETYFYPRTNGAVETTYYLCSHAEAVKQLFNRQ